MLLSEQLKEIIDKTNVDWDSAKVTLGEMIKLCFGKVEEDMKKDMSIENCVTAFQRVNNIWNLTAKYADKIGKPIMKIDGFKDFVKSKDVFKEIHSQL